MTVLTSRPRRAPLDLFALLIQSHPAALLGAHLERRRSRDAEAALASVPAHLRDDIGLPPLPEEEAEPPAMARARLHARNWA